MDNVTDRIAEARTTLLCGRSMDADVSYLCRDLLEARIAAGRRLLLVTYTGSPAARLDQQEWDPEDVAGVLVVGQGPGTVAEDLPVDVDVVPAPSDHIAMGIKLNQFLQDSDGDLVVCFDSVTELLQYTDEEKAYRFLHIVTSHMADADARAHLHVNSGAHADRTVDALASLCDAIVDLDADPQVRTRWDDVEPPGA